jgi:hypothetical protein
MVNAIVQIKILLHQVIAENTDNLSPQLATGDLIKEPKRF